MMKRFLLASFLGANLLFIAAPSLFASPRQTTIPTRLSVLDYYFLLPGIGMDGHESEREKRELSRPERKPTFDFRNDYLLVRPESFPAQQIAIFRGSGLDLIAASSPDCQSDYNAFRLYRLNNGQLRDVTQQVLPVPARVNRFLYELPRVGTTIHVFEFSFLTQTRKPAFDLLWRRGRFVVVKLKR